MWGTTTSLHVFKEFWQDLKKGMTLEGLVAHFTSVKPFPQAEDETNHMKAKAAVTNRSLKRGTKKKKIKLKKILTAA